MERVAEAFVALAGLYVAFGLVFAVVFAVRGIGAVDPGARDASPGFRCIVTPGVVALWPLLAKRWWSGRGAPPVESNAHRRAAERRR